MLPVRSLRRWAIVHKWTSLICTAFLLIVCVTGLPIVFAHELSDWLDPDPPYAELPEATPRADLDDLVRTARGMFPGEIIRSIFIDDDEPRVIVAMAPSWQASREDRKSNHFISFDARTAQILEQSGSREQRGRSLVGILVTLHVDLFAGLPGALFVGTMGLLFVIAVISGIVLYGPAMRKLEFGTIRVHRTRRVKWLDLHNLMGIVTLAWALVIGLTGVMNELSRPLFALWQQTVVEELIAPWQGRKSPDQAELGSLRAALDTASRALPGKAVISVVYPGNDTGSPHHFLIWGKGDTPLTGRLFTPVLVDARTGELTAIVQMPWYLLALQVSRPLHFGDYGGMPLKIIWALLDLVTIAVLLSGLYLWLSRRRSSVGSQLAEREAE